MTAAERLMPCCEEAAGLRWIDGGAAPWQRDEMAVPMADAQLGDSQGSLSMSEYSQ